MESESESAEEVKKTTTTTTTSAATSHSHSPSDGNHDPEIAIHPGDSDDDDVDHGSSASTSTSPPRSKIPKPPTQPPPNQEMERYRIPPSVFERNKSATPADWSAASNESLFSIHMGNMSESWRSDELGPPTASTSDQMFCYSAHSSAGGGADMRSRELGIAEATMLEVIKENEGRSQPSTPTLSEARHTRRSAGSNQSNMSFAFSIAGGDAERIARSVSSNHHQQPPQTSHPVTSPEPQPDDPAAAKEKETTTKTQSRWCFCFPCCSYC